MTATHDDPESSKMPLLEHLVELRRRLLYSVVAFLIAFFICYGFSQDIYGFLLRPLAQAMEAAGGSQRMIYTELTEVFFTYLKVSAFGALVVTFPVFASQFWLFLAPGLYRHEKKALLPFLVATPLLFALGAAMVYYVVMPMAWTYLLGFQTGAADTVLPIQLEAKVGEYLGLVMTLIFAFGISFEMPVLLTLLARVGLVTATGLADKRRFAIVGVFVFAAILTPPDVISQIALAIPMLGLYEISILTCRMMEKKRRESEENDPDFDETDFNEG
ncbi:MAG: twin-arginine translocase subunit TatC [Alphaproteobacteria bacterium]|nr:twin-arginine translocase subunit TatC [Alphaproteobacteria bacterium]MBF0129598.1 twin-arginine translocase subunit TatC [Alphaproteobacteria bacterium]